MMARVAFKLLGVHGRVAQNNVNIPNDIVNWNGCKSETLLQESKLEPEVAEERFVMEKKLTKDSVIQKIVLCLVINVGATIAELYQMRMTGMDVLANAILDGVAKLAQHHTIFSARLQLSAPFNATISKVKRNAKLLAYTQGYRIAHNAIGMEILWDA